MGGSEERRKELGEMGLFDTLADVRWEHSLLPALRSYLAQHGHLEVPHDFVVPSEVSVEPV